MTRKLPEVEESPRILQIAEVNSLSNQDLVRLYQQSKAIAEASDGDIWAIALINQQSAEAIIRQRGKKKGSAV